jgi:hypothetical protein
MITQGCGGRGNHNPARRCATRPVAALTAAGRTRGASQRPPRAGIRAAEAASGSGPFYSVALLNVT